MFKSHSDVVLKVSKRLAHVPHVSCFSFSIYFSSTPLPSSLSLCIWFSLPSPLPALLCLYLSSTTLSPTLSTLSSVFLTAFFSDPVFLLSISLAGCDSIRPPLQPTLLPPAHTFFRRYVCPTQLPPPHFPWESVSAFPSFEALSRLFQ